MPFHAYALSGSNLISFSSSNPTIGTTIAITNVTPGQTLVGIDFRPATGQLYTLGVNAITDVGTVYIISPQTGVATAVGSFNTAGDLPPGTAYGFDFNPTVDRIRVMTDTGLNFRLNPNNGSLSGSDTGSGNALTGVAYTNNQPDGGSITTLYALDSTIDVLMFLANPNSGMATAHGALGIDFTAVNGFDIPAGVNATAAGTPVSSGTGFAILTQGGSTGLFSINLATGAATILGTFLDGLSPVSGFAIQNPGLPFDLDGDRNGDFLLQNANGTPMVWTVDGNSVTTTGPALLNPGPSAHAKDAADFNGDGKADILFQNDNGTPSVWLMNGTGVATVGDPLLNPGPSAHAIAAADFNFDGKADILWQNANGTPSIWLMDGTSVLATGPALTNPGPSAHAKDAADFNADGKADILWQNDNGTPSVWLMDGVNVALSGPALTNPGPTAHVIKAADFNADGKADILWQNDNGTPSVWLMDGVNVATIGPALFNPGRAWHIIDARDTNGDGKADIILQNDDGTPAIWQMDGVNVSSLSPTLPNPGSDWHLI